MAEPEYCEKNTLAELAEEAEELKRVLEDLKFDRRVVVCDKLQRIVAELAKVELHYIDGKAVEADLISANDAVMRCRAIADKMDDCESEAR